MGLAARYAVELVVVGGHIAADVRLDEGATVVAANVSASTVLVAAGIRHEWLKAPAPADLRSLQQEIFRGLVDQIVDADGRRILEVGANHMVWRLQWWAWRRRQIADLAGRGRLRATVGGEGDLEPAWIRLLTELRREGAVHSIRRLR